MTTDDATVLQDERPQLMGLAYRLLGSRTEAEDAVQEAYARWYAMAEARRVEIVSPGAWLSRVLSRICLDLLGSARARRERYVGDWLPEPLPAHTDWLANRAADPAEQVALDESLSVAFLVVLDTLTPAERVAFVLHDVFRYSFDEVAGVLDRSSPASRQLASSARRRISDAHIPATADDEQAAAVRAFMRAWQGQDVAALLDVLDPDATAVADGGGLASVVGPVAGAEQVANAYVELFTSVPGLAVAERTVNGRPGLVTMVDGAVVSVLAFDVADGRITRMWTMRNPEKLRAWTAQ